MISSSTLYFMIEVLAAEFLFLWSYRKRRFFALRMIAVIGVCCAAAAFYPNLRFGEGKLYSSLGWFFRFFSLFLLSIAGQCFLFQASLRAIVSACAAAYAAQHFSHRIFSIIDVYCPLFDHLDRTLSGLIKMVFYFTPLYALCYFLFVKRANKRGYQNEGDVRLDVISVLVVFMCMGVSRISGFGNNADPSKMAENIYAAICCILVLFLQYTLYGMIAKDKELQTKEQLYEKGKEEYRSWQNSVDVINAKCHDLKQHIVGLRENYSEEGIREIEESVMIYDSAIKTGNATLDLILFEKNIQCEKSGIEFVYIADGSGLSFMSNEDVFSLFGNILTNAIEAVSSMKEEAKRVIHLSVCTVANTIVVHEENYCPEGEIAFENGLPTTTKKDKTQHGFGTKSIKMIADKYEGSAEFRVHKDVFSLNVGIPVKGK